MITKTEFLKAEHDLVQYDDEQILEWLKTQNTEKFALAVSFQMEEVILIHKLRNLGLDIQYFTLDTGRLPQASYAHWQELEKTFGIHIEARFPSENDILDLVSKQGPNGFYDSLENRKSCCYVRKVLPLKKKLEGLEGWITGLRQGQSLSRWNTAVIQWDDDHNIPKINPLARWSFKDCQDYISKNNLPLNELYSKGYSSIGCDPCTRAVEKGEDLRAGRWWWEEADKKECGLHVSNSEKKPQE